MIIKSSSTQSKYVVQQENDIFLIDLNTGNYFNKELFLLWLKPKKAIFLSKEDLYAIEKSNAFKSGTPIVFIVGIAFLIITLIGNFLSSLTLDVSILFTVILTLLGPILVGVFIKKNSVKDKVNIEQALKREISEYTYVQINFNKKASRVKYIIRIIFAFICIIGLILVGAIMFISTGLVMALIVYLVGLYALMGTSYIFPTSSVMINKIL